MKIIVHKYGGSSVADTQKIMGVARKISSKLNADNRIVVVVSAMGKTTDGLVRLAREIAPEPSPRELDMLLATGEQVTAALLSMALHNLSVRSVSLNAYQAGITTTKEFSEARIKNFKKEKILKLLESNDVLVVTGFQGVTEAASCGEKDQIHNLRRNARAGKFRRKGAAFEVRRDRQKAPHKYLLRFNFF
jgi:aspartate kinase